MRTSEERGRPDHQGCISGWATERDVCISDRVDKGGLVVDNINGGDGCPGGMANEESGSDRRERGKGACRGPGVARSTGLLEMAEGKSSRPGSCSRPKRECGCRHWHDGSGSDAGRVTKARLFRTPAQLPEQQRCARELRNRRDVSSLAVPTTTTMQEGMRMAEEVDLAVQLGRAARIQ